MSASFQLVRRLLPGLWPPFAAQRFGISHSAMVGCELELWGEGGHVVHDGVWRVCAAEWILVCVWFVWGGGGEGECVAMVAVAYLRCDGSGGGSVNDGEQGCEDDGGGE